jgi:hypothetical protein
MLDRADDLAALTVLDADGNALALGTLWQDRAAVLAFVRHFG